MLGDFDMPICRHDVHYSGQQRFLIHDRADGHGAVSGQNLAEMTGIRGIKMLGQHDGRREIGRQSGDQG